MSTLINDLKYALRQLVNKPGFTIVVLLVLALGIGVNSAIISIVRDVIFDPLPQETGDKLMHLHVHNPARFITPGVSSQYWEELRSQDDFFEAIASYRPFRLDLEGDEFVDRLRGSRVMPSFFSMLGIRPQLGRIFSAEEVGQGNDNRIMLSHGLWQRQYAGDSDIVGQTIILSQTAYMVVGVMPREFEFPRGGVQFWIPMEAPHLVEASLALPLGKKSISGNWPVMFRPRAGVTVARLQTLFNTLNQRYVQSNASDNEGWITEVQPLRHRFSDADLRTAFYGILVAVLFVLLIGCFNLASLLLAKFESRRSEFAIRQAIGARRFHLVRQLMAESFLLSILGAVAGFAVAYWSIQLMTMLVPAHMPRMKEIQLDRATVLTSMGLALGVCVLTGLFPAIQATRQTLSGVLKEAANSLSLDIRRRVFRHAQVILQLSLTLVLLAGAGLMIRSMVELLQVDLGYQVENLVRVELDLPDDLKTPAEHERRNRLFSQIEERYEAISGVKSAAVSAGGWDMDYLPEGAEKPVNAQPWLCSVEDSGLFSTLQASLVRGRHLSREDALGAGGDQSGVVVNETMARLFWPGQDPIGKRFSPNFGFELPEGVQGMIFTMEGAGGLPMQFFRRVIGVVSDVKESSYEQEIKPRFYEPYQRGGQVFAANIMVRCHGNPVLLLKPLREILAELGPGFGNPKITLMKDVLYDSTAPQRAFLKFLVVFSVAGLMLSAVGLYGVLAYEVSRRTREIGIRMALGAERGHVLGMVMSEGTRLVIVGLATGLVAAFGLTRFLRSQLFEVSPADPVVLVSVVLLLMAVAAAACLFPAIRASRINPMTALRCE